MKTQRRTMDCTDVPLGGNRTLRLALERDGDGEPDALHLLIGWGEGTSWQEDRLPTRGEAITVPADTVPALLDALQALTDHP
jgi:hypothetical protein